MGTRVTTCRAARQSIWNRKKRHARVEVNVAVHTAEKSCLGAPSTTRAEHNEVVTAALELVDDLRSGISGALNPMDDDVFRDIGCSCRENSRRPPVELGSHRFAVETSEGDVTRDRRRDGDQSQLRVPGPREIDCVLESAPGRERAVDTDEDVEEQGLGQFAQGSCDIQCREDAHRSNRSRIDDDQVRRLVLDHQPCGVVERVVGRDDHNRCGGCAAGRG